MIEKSTMSTTTIFLVVKNVVLRKLIYYVMMFRVLKTVSNTTSLRKNVCLCDTRMTGNTYCSNRLHIKNLQNIEKPNNNTVRYLCGLERQKMPSAGRQRMCSLRVITRDLFEMLIWFL